MSATAPGCKSTALGPLPDVLHLVVLCFPAHGKRQSKRISSRGLQEQSPSQPCGVRIHARELNRARTISIPALPHSALWCARLAPVAVASDND